MHASTMKRCHIRIFPRWIDRYVIDTGRIENARQFKAFYWRQSCPCACHSLHQRFLSSNCLLLYSTPRLHRYTRSLRLIICLPFQPSPMHPIPHCPSPTHHHPHHPHRRLHRHHRRQSSAHNRHGSRSARGSEPCTRSL